MTNKSEIEKLLMKDDLFREHFIEKHPPKYKNFRKINPIFLGRESDNVIYWLKDFVNFPLIEDDFVGIQNEYHIRGKWKSELEKRYGEDVLKYLTRNKLRINTSVGGLSTVGFFVNEFLGEFPELKKKSEKLLNLQNYNKNEYYNKNSSERIEFVRGLEDDAYNVLWELVK
jgi:hypothetical protein